MMRLKDKIFSLSLIIVINFFFISVPAGSAAPGDQAGKAQQDSATYYLPVLTESLQQVIESGADLSQASGDVENIERIVAEGKVTDTLALSDACYFLGHYYLRSKRYNQAGIFFTASGRYREDAGVADRRYALSLSNMAVVLFRKGDFTGAYEIGLRGLEAKRRVSGSDSSSLASNYLNLASTLLEMHESDKALALAESGLQLIRQFPDRADPKVTADLYQVIGLSLYRNSEYTKSLDYCREALRLYELNGTSEGVSKELIYNTISQIYIRLGEPGEAEKYFRKGLSLGGDENMEDKYLLYINYADFLAENGRAGQGEKVLEEGIGMVDRIFGPQSRDYCMMLASKADFIGIKTGDRQQALKIYEGCFPYLTTHPWDVSMRKYILTDYAEILYAAGQYGKVLETVDTLIVLPQPAEPSDHYSKSSGSYSDDDIEILLLRYRALNALAAVDGDTEKIREAIATGRAIVSLYDRQRLEMSEDDSRTSLSAFSRDLYTGMVNNYVELYGKDHARSSLDGAFEFSERSKVAGFLASMRELNAAKFSLPPELVNLDNAIRKDIGLYRELMAKERNRAMPDSQKIAIWESVTFSLLRSRDSLMKVFETRYPSYYSLKYRTFVTPLEDVPQVITGKANLLSYILTADRLYLFVTNSRRSEIITREIDSSFYSKLIRFRRMLSEVPATSNVRQPFNDFMDLAYDLYTVLLEPAVPYLRGDKIIISPDNILSYLPFETLVTEEFRSPELLYREAPFALKKYRFSYIYSVTLSSETQERSRSLRNTLVAFAPTYTGMEINDSLYNLFPNLRGPVRSLPYAVAEAEDAVTQCGGAAFTDTSATEERYKSEARKYDIIHLAMHTLVDDNNPAFSRMIFSAPGNGSDDGFLNTYEVYSIPINAMMVVLSSCNTGSGKLVNGEGILSLARGFLFAGSRSVVMSMWEVEDYSASAVVKSFYKNMRSGQTKSAALRNARLSFLRRADQTRSHPYYWAALVIYGDDTPLWYDRVKLYSGLLLLLIASAVLVATVYRGPRS
jgi:CHAT domain-containing protein